MQTFPEKLTKQLTENHLKAINEVMVKYPTVTLGGSISVAFYYENFTRDIGDVDFCLCKEEYYEVVDYYQDLYDEFSKKSNIILNMLMDNDSFVKMDEGLKKLEKMFEDGSVQDDDNFSVKSEHDIKINYFKVPDYHCIPSHIIEITIGETTAILRIAPPEFAILAKVIYANCGILKHIEDLKKIGKYYIKNNNETDLPF